MNIDLTPDQIRKIEADNIAIATQFVCGEPKDCGTTLKVPSPCQCNQQLIDIIGNLVAVLRERSHD